MMTAYECFLAGQDYLNKHPECNVRWRYASEDTPKDGQRVLVAAYSPYMKRIIYSKDIYYEEFGGYIPSVEYGRVVIAWIPIMEEKTQCS